MIGQQCCYKHGGNSPQAKRKARERVADLALPKVSQSFQRVISGTASRAELEQALRAMRLINA
jgi:hypothetical protein